MDLTGYAPDILAQNRGMQQDGWFWVYKACIRGGIKRVESSCKYDDRTRKTRPGTAGNAESEGIFRSVRRIALKFVSKQPVIDSAMTDLPYLALPNVVSQSLVSTLKKA
jgi:hypothetical protein